MGKRGGKRKPKQTPAAVDTISVTAEGEAILGPTPERRRHYDGGASTFTTETGRVIERLNVVTALYEADEISPEAFLAITRYLTDYEVAYMTKTTSSFSDPVDGRGNVDSFNAKRMDADKRFNHAKAAIGHNYAHVIKLILIDDMTLAAYAVAHLGISPKSHSKSLAAKRHLIKAMNALAKHYGPLTDRPPPRMRGHIDDGARPVIHPFQQDDAA